MKRNVDALTDGPFDLIVLGGGITGAGVALDATLRGLRVALIDKGDFASGTSSISSKLVHGGLRYLEHADIPLVYEALHERALLLSNAPHLVHPLRFVLPFYRGGRVPAWRWRAGLTLYDLLAGSGNIRRSRPLGRACLAREFPGLRAESLTGGAEYYDAQMDDARLCIEVVKTAAEHGSCVANYVEAVDFARQSGLITGVRAIDHVTGRQLVIEARQVLNATGPWVDAVCRLAGDEGGPRLRPTKGVHLVAPGRGLTSAFLLLHPRDGRVFFVIPWLGKTLVGTTDTEHHTPPDDVRATPDDLRYLLEGHNHYFSPPLSERDLLGHFVGLRPLLRARPAEPSSLSREFRLFWSPSGLLSVAGGKYTTYRHMAEVITDAVVRRLGVRRHSHTRRQRLDGAPDEPWPAFRDRTIASLKKAGLSAEAAWHLVHRYGRRALEVAAYIERNAALARPAHPDEPDLCAEFLYQRDHEMALFPADFLLRRTRIGLFHPDRLAVSAPSPAS
ncbi:MAG: glycerol-3-phosphate dehydrogenase [Planctomycetes bacterium]|nr:glycerol-3-phosphate dehydrogenase [Planctomycetota bacterium]